METKLVREIAYLIAPLAFAGLIHHLVIIKYNLFGFLAKPIDGGKLLNKKPVLGRAKTWRGMLAVPLLAGIGSLVISRFISVPAAVSPPLVGFITGLGYSIAELPNSFVKRRLNIEPGKKKWGALGNFFSFFDQVDSVLGAILFLLFIYPASLVLCIWLFIIGSSLHFLIDLYLYKHGYKRII